MKSNSKNRARLTIMHGFNSSHFTNLSLKIDISLQAFLLPFRAKLKSRSGGRLNVLIHPEKVIRVVLTFDLFKFGLVGAVG